MVASWKFILAQAKDLLPLGDLTQARNKQISVALNRSGSASFSIPMDDELGSIIYPHSHALLAYRNGSLGPKLVWSGGVNTIDEDIAGNRMTVNCVGWLDRLAKRVPHQDLIYNAIDDGQIVQNLLAEANGISTGEYVSGSAFTVADGITMNWPAGSSPNLPTWIKWGGTLPNEGPGGATAYATSSRSASYTRYQTSILQAIQQLSEIENGCDFWIHPASRQLYVYRKRRRVLPNVVFGFQWGPENVAQLNRQLDGSTLDNLHIVTGATGSTPSYQADTTSQQQYGVMEEYTTLSDVAITGTLQAFASAEVAVRSQPRQLFSMTPFNWTSENAVPEPFVDYDIGDQVSFSAVAPPRIQIAQQVRVFGMQFTIDEEDNERIGQLQIYPGG